MLCAFCTVALAADADVAPLAVEKPSLDTDPTGGENGGSTNGGTESGSTDNGSTESSTENSTRSGIDPITVVILIAVPAALAAAAWLVYISVKKKN